MQTSVLVFKTNINTLEKLQKVDSALSQRAEIVKWNVDLDDCDKVLRIETNLLKTNSVMEMMRSQEIYCEELL
ncbi:MAG: hypothetical protein ACJ77K_04280 [Bacteroidia bacterium]